MCVQVCVCACVCVCVCVLCSSSFSVYLCWNMYHKVHVSCFDFSGVIKTNTTTTTQKLEPPALKWFSPVSVFLFVFVCVCVYVCAHVCVCVCLPLVSCVLKMECPKTPPTIILEEWKKRKEKKFCGFCAHSMEWRGQCSLSKGTRKIYLRWLG